jgi:hypothetical protein
METAHMMEAKIGQLQRRKKSHRHRRNHPVKVAKDAPNRWPHCVAAKSTSREFFERVMSSKHNCEDRSDLIIPLPVGDRLLPTRGKLPGRLTLDSTTRALRLPAPGI